MREREEFFSDGKLKWFNKEPQLRIYLNKE